MAAASFVVANGEKMCCDQFVPQFEWGVQGHTFVQDMKILPLGCYDMILGHDWLDDKIPMWIHWRRKIMHFSHLGRRITLHGITDNTSTCRPVQLSKLPGSQRRGAISQIVQLQLKPDGQSFQVDVVDQGTGQADSPIVPQIQQLLDEFVDVFDKPTTLPPSREIGRAHV